VYPKATARTGASPGVAAMAAGEKGSDDLESSRGRHGAPDAPENRAVKRGSRRGSESSECSVQCAVCSGAASNPTYKYLVYPKATARTGASLGVAARAAGEKGSDDLESSCGRHGAPDAPEIPLTLSPAATLDLGANPS
jgi:hypothetical protein